MKYEIVQQHFIIQSQKKLRRLNKKALASVYENQMRYMMKTLTVKLLMAGLLTFACASNAQASNETWSWNHILTGVSVSPHYKGCLAHVERELPWQCSNRSKRWVNLDCDSTYFDYGEERYTTALMAKALKRKVNLLISWNNQDKLCVVKRIDVF